MNLLGKHLEKLALILSIYADVLIVKEDSLVDLNGENVKNKKGWYFKWP